MTKKEENEVLAQWAGIECRCEQDQHPFLSSELSRYWGNCPRHSSNGYPPDYDRDEVAITLMSILSRKTHMLYTLDIYPDGVATCYPTDTFRVLHNWQPTIAAAIKAAVLQLIEKEKQ
jgi:hypothetical protein